MRITSVVVFCAICVSLASCSDKKASTCVGGSKTGMSVERMSDVDKYFMTTDFSRYIGSPLGGLEHDFAFKYKDRVAVTKPPAQLMGLTYSFPGNYSLHVYFIEAKYTHYNNKTNKWDFGKIGKEKISGIKVDHVGAGDFYYCKDYGEVTQ